MLGPLMPGRASFIAVSLALVSLGGCGDPVVTPVDAAQPDSYLPMGHLLGSCFASSQCPGVGAVCRTADMGYPNGQCTNPCTDRTDCDDGLQYNECLMPTGTTTASCEAYCRNGSDCRDGYTCQVLSTDASGATRGVCIPACATDAECGGTSQCNVYTGRCVPHGMVPTTGGDTGEACTGNAACRSANCRLPVENGNYTGYVGGYCESICRIPSGYNTSNFFSADTLPQGTCSGNAVCVPGGNEQGAGDLGVCLHSCSGASDCRAGYSCTQTVSSHTFTNGFCVPTNCLLAGHACPSGTTCHMGADSAGNPVGICG